MRIPFHLGCDEANTPNARAASSEAGETESGVTPARQFHPIRMRTGIGASAWLGPVEMQTATANANNFEYVARPRIPVVAEALIPAGWLLTIGLLNLFYAISVLAGSHIFITTASWLVGDTRPEGWLVMVVSLAQLAAAPGVLLGRLGAWAVGLLSVVGHLVALVMFFPDAPGIAAALIAMDLVVAACLLALLRSTRSPA